MSWLLTSDGMDLTTTSAIGPKSSLTSSSAQVIVPRSNCRLIGDLDSQKIWKHTTNEDSGEHDGEYREWKLGIFANILTPNKVLSKSGRRLKFGPSVRGNCDQNRSGPRTTDNDAGTSVVA